MFCAEFRPVHGRGLPQSGAAAALHEGPAADLVRLQAVAAAGQERAAAALVLRQER